ncbi:hypothetical protein [Prevotella pallens]|uniref:hypothetical protein n=1 Tax=Prevotella pallens TaxID=60133 RepID=UPI000E0FC898|nr:hypothetical protein [Prevotella pallens]
MADRQQRNGKPQAAVGADLSCPHIRIRHAFAIRSEHIHGMFATHFVGGRCIINNPFAMFWQSVRSVMANHKQP